MAVTEVDEKSFRNYMIRDNHSLVVANFYAKWYEPCVATTSTLQKIATCYKDQAVFINVDVDKCQALKKARGITHIPTLIFYKNGKEVGRHFGADCRYIETRIPELIKKYSVIPTETITAAAIAASRKRKTGEIYSFGGSVDSSSIKKIKPFTGTGQKLDEPKPLVAKGWFSSLLSKIGISWKPNHEVTSIDARTNATNLTNQTEELDANENDPNLQSVSLLKVDNAEGVANNMNLPHLMASEVFKEEDAPLTANTNTPNSKVATADSQSIPKNEIPEDAANNKNSPQLLTSEINEGVLENISKPDETVPEDVKKTVEELISETPHPKIKIRLRLHDGARLQATLPASHQCKSIRSFILTQRPYYKTRLFTLVTGFPNTTVIDETKTIEEANLAQSTVMIRFEDVFEDVQN